MSRNKIPFSELRFIYSKSTGAGGQNVNKLNTKVTLIWDLENSNSCPDDIKFKIKNKFPSAITKSGEILITSQESRSQKMNQNRCIEKLHHMISQAEIVPKVRKKTKPKRSSVLKRLESKKRNSNIKKLRKNNF